MKRLALAAMLASSPALADSLTFSAPSYERGGTATATYRAEPPAPFGATLAVEWTDSLGRTVERRTMQVAGPQPVTITLDLRRAVATANTLRATLQAPGLSRPIETPFIASPQPETWRDYRVIMWQPQTAERYRALRRLGITAGNIIGLREGELTAARFAPLTANLLAADMRWYVENIATDFYAPYHRWTPEHPRDVAWLFKQAQASYRANPADPAAVTRTPSLSDPEWRARIAARLRDTALVQQPFRPLYFSLGDEIGIGDLAANWDFDFSPAALAGFRTWLQRLYGSLAALNQQWDSDFADWNAVMPMRTTQAMAQPRDNFSAWADFKAYMDASFADAIRAGTDAVHAGDPTAFAAIEGAQVPGWGGFDYARLADAVDLMEMYDRGGNVEIVRSLNPALPVLTTSFNAGPGENWRIWHEAMLGGRGLIIWDGDGKFLGPDGTPGPRAQAMAPVFSALTHGLAAQLIAGTPHVDQVAILYSPASQRTHWLLDNRAGGDAWINRDAEREHEEETPTRLARAHAARVLNQLGLQPQWLTQAQIAADALRTRGIRALLLPQAIALSAAEAASLRHFVRGGGLLLAEGPVGLFDDHSRRLAAPALEGVAIGPLGNASEVGKLLTARGIAAGFRLLATDGTPAPGVDVRVWTNGGVTLLGLHTAAPTAVPDFDLALPRPAWIRDLAGGTAQRAGRLRLHLDPIRPTILAIMPTPLPRLTLSATHDPGEPGLAHIALATPSTAAAHAIRLEVRDPADHLVDAYSGNLILRGRTETWPLPFAASDPPGRWTIRATDLLSGASASAAVDLK